MQVNFNEEKHIYSIKEHIIPSVTQIISEIIGYPFYASEWHMNRGRVVHKCAELIAHGKTFTWDEQVDGYVKAIFRFFDEVKPKVKFVEKIVYSKVYDFAGTIDLVAQIGNWNFILDYKNSFSKDQLGLQLAAYTIALWETEKIRVVWNAGVELSNTGNYKLHRINENYPGKYEKEFLALRTVYGIKQRNNLLTKGE